MAEAVESNDFSVSPALSKKKRYSVPEHERKYALLKTLDVELAPVIAIGDIAKRFFNDNGGTFH